MLALAARADRPAPPRVVIAAGPRLLRAATAGVLEHAGLCVVGEAADPPDLVRKVRAHAPDVAVVDVRFPLGHGDDGADAIRTLRAEHRAVAVLVLAERVEPGYAEALVAAGAEGAGYLLDGRVPDVARFVNAAREIAAGGSVLEPQVVTQLVRRRDRAHGLGALSDRDRAVLEQLADGRTNGAIAQRLFLSERAVERHVTAIFGKLGIAASRDTHRRVLAALAHVHAAA